MAGSLGQSRLANGPFKMIETPVHAQKLSKPYDQYSEFASLMALTHNMLIRGLNSIYRQAPHVAPEDRLDFIAYASCWAEVLNSHHHGEEECLFPIIERETGEKGIMEENVEQHHAFLPGLEAYQSYLISMATTPKDFSGTHLNKIIDNFAPALLAHLSDEIPSLLSLSRFEGKLQLLAAGNAMRSAQPLSKTGGVIFFFRNLDTEFEGGLWQHWPPIPGVVRWVMLKMLGRWNTGWWRFASCDESGRLKELYALAK